MQTAQTKIRKKIRGTFNADLQYSLYRLVKKLHKNPKIYLQLFLFYAIIKQHCLHYPDGKEFAEASTLRYNKKILLQQDFLYLLCFYTRMCSLLQPLRLAYGEPPPLAQGRLSLKRTYSQSTTTQGRLNLGGSLVGRYAAPPGACLRKQTEGLLSFTTLPSRLRCATSPCTGEAFIGESLRHVTALAQGKFLLGRTCWG